MTWAKTSFWAVVFILMLGVFYFSRITQDTYSGNVEVLYSAIAEGYLAFFALVLTLIFVSIQLSPYSHVELAHYIFNTQVILYLLLLVVTIFFPFIMLLLANETHLALFISISLSVASFIIFPSLLIHIRDKLRPSNIINNSVFVVIKNISNKRTSEVSSEVDRIFRIATQASMLDDYITIENALDGLQSIFEKVASIRTYRQFELIEDLIERIRGLRRIFFGNSFSIKIMLRALVKIGKHSLRYELPKVDIGRVMEIIELIPWQAINIGDSLALQESIRAYNELLNHMADTLHNKGFQSSLAKWYVLIGSYGLQKSNIYCQRIILLSLISLIKADTIDYSIACREAQKAVKVEPFWELEPSYVMSFVEMWPQDKLLPFEQRFSKGSDTMGQVIPQ